MRRPIRASAVAALLVALCVPVRAQEPAATGDLGQRVEELEAEVARLREQGAGVGAERLAELERRLDLLAAELEKARSGAAESEPSSGSTVPGLGPGAGKVYAAGHGVSIGGYAELVYDRPAETRQDGAPSGRVPTIDMVRNVLYVGYKFSDRILFNSELEFEHASTGEGSEEKGEVSVEFGYLDFKPWRSVGLRAGLVLVPVGFLNELHEAPVFHGARRPEVESVIIPSTWRENGLGVYGSTGPFEWRAYLLAGLASRGFDASGMREGRQGGSQSLARDLAVTSRLDFTGLPGLLVGASLFTGNSSQSDGPGARVTLWEAHGQFERGGLQLRGLLARTAIGDVAAVNAANGLLGAASVGERQYGWYLEAAYDLMALRPAGRWSVTPFLRYERLDTQQRVPAGFDRDPARRASILTAGVGVKPLANVVLKADYRRSANDARTGGEQVDLGVGLLF